MKPQFFAYKALVLAGLLTLAASSANAQSARLRGVIVSADPTTLVVRARDGGDVTLQLAPGVTVGRRVRVGIDAIHPQDFVGVAAVPGSGDTLKAVEIFIFPASQRGVGEGHRPFDVFPEGTMTNATIAETVDSVDGKAMRLTYKGGEKSIAITPESKIFVFAQGAVADLLPGRVVSLAAERKDDQITTSRVTVDDP